jgi:hypothetical protein
MAVVAKEAVMTARAESATGVVTAPLYRVVVTRGATIPWIFTTKRRI